MLKRFRERAGSESGFTLVELLVVMLILGILAAIAIPAFFNQREKANDAAKKTEARTMQTAAETYATDNNGLYDPPGAAIMTVAALTAIEPTIGDGAGDPVVTVPAPDEFVVRSAPADNSGNVFSITRSGDGTTDRTCTTAGTGGCPSNGSW